MLRIRDFITNKKSNIAFYLGGIFLLGFAINTMKASALGTGAWDTVIINGRDFLNQNIGWSFVTMGMISLTLSLIIMTIVMLYRRRRRYLFMLLPVFLVALSIDLWNFTLFHDREASRMVYQVGFFTAGTMLLPLGLTMMVKSKFPAFVFDELMLMLVSITHAKKITYIRLSIEVTGISIGAIFGYLTYYHINQSFGAVNVGSFILTVLLSPIMALYFKLFAIGNTS